MLAHELAGLVPDRDQDALAFVVAGTVAVRLAEVADRDRSVDRRDDLRQLDSGWVPGQDIAATDAAFGAHQPGALEGEEDLLEVWLGQPRSLGDIAH